MVQGAEKKFIESRVNLPTDKGSAEIARDIPAVIRARAFFSARVAEAHILERFREISDRYSSGEISRDEARHLLRQFARSEGKDDGTKALRNLASTARLNLILDQNAKMARAVGQYEAMHRPANLQMFPYVIYRASVGSKHPRGSHGQFDGKVIAKNDPWLKNHWPPWEFGCNCDLQNCTAKKAAGLPRLTDEDRKVASQSGFEFDPSTAFEEFDYSLIKDYELREKARIGVANILKGVPDQSSLRLDVASESDFPSSQPESAESKTLDEFAEELEQRVRTEASEKVFPAQPKEFLQGEDLERAKAQARKAVPAEVMQTTDDAVEKIGVKGLMPFLHYSSRPGDSENIVLRQASFKDGEIDWTGVKATPVRKKAVAALQDLLEKMPKFRGTVYRGCAFETEEAFHDYLKKLFAEPENLMGFISTTPDPVVAHHYASADKYKVVIVVPNSQNGVYFGPYSRHPEDEETLISYKFFLKGLQKYEHNGILYVLAEELPR